MPTRIFTALDAATLDFTVDSAAVVQYGPNQQPPTEDPLSDYLSETGVGSWEMDLNLLGSTVANDNFAINITGDEVSPVLTQEWEINYLNFPSIPENAQIKKLTFRRPRTVNYTFDNDISPNASMNFSFEDNTATPIYFTQETESNYIAPKLVSEAIEDSDADEIIFDHTGTDDFVTRAELISTYSEFNNNAFNIFISNFVQGVGINGEVTIAGSLVFGLGWQVEVEYEEGYQWSIPQPDEPVEAGDTIQLTSPVVELPELSVDFTDVTQIDMLVPDYNNPGTFFTVNIPIGDWSNITTNSMNVLLPAFPVGNTEPTVIRIQLTSTQFSGTVSQQLYTIFFVSASGIYELVSGKTNDTLYIEAEPGETIDVKIPNPTGRTGFF